MNASPGTLVVSLDFELHWGIRDKKSVADYRAWLDGVRSAIPRLLRLFEAYDVHATWATVGFLFFETRDELLQALPARKPEYPDPGLSPYSSLEDDLGPDEDRDPYHFAPSLLRRIAATPGQEIGTHTFSHYYTRDATSDPDVFREDLCAARRAAARLGVDLRSIVFPRNQYTKTHLAVCAEEGLSAYRGNPRSWLHTQKTHPEVGRRLARLADAYLPLTGSASAQPELDQGLVDVRASRFFRPYDPRFPRAERLKQQRIVGELRNAAERGEVYHLWWHPHNFGAHPDRNLAQLEQILDAFSDLRERGNMRSLNMDEIAREQVPEA